jgi:hypothetical protein
MSRDEDLKDLWQSQDVPKTEIDMQALSIKATDFQKTIKRRNLLEYAAALLVVPVFVHGALYAEPTLTRIGAILIVLGVGVVVTHIHLRGHASSEAPPVDGPTQRLVAWHRAELERQRQLLLRVPVWYVGPLIPGMVLHQGGYALERSEAWPSSLFAILLASGIVVAILWANRAGARKLERQIAELDG